MSSLLDDMVLKYPTIRH